MNSGLFDNALKKLKNIKKKIRHAFLSLSGVFSVLKRGYLLKSIKRAHLAAGIIIAFGVIGAGGVLTFSGFSVSESIVDAESLQWTQDAGAGITVPACGSTTACGAPGQNVVCTTCSGGAPSVEFTWTDGASTANLACQTVRIGTWVTGSPAVRIAGSLPCAGTYIWTGGANATNYNYQVRYHTATKTTCTGGYDKFGNCLGWTTETVTYPRDETVCTGGYDKFGNCLGWTTETNYGHLINEGSFSTPNCTLPPVCSPASVSLDTGQTQTFSVSEGSAPFTWDAPSSSNPSGSGSTHNTSYSSSGPYSVRVTDSLSRTSECSVTVNPAAIPPTCSADPSAISTRQNTTATGSGGSGSYTWSGGENPATGSGLTFTTNYTAAGSKTITVTGGGSNTCPVTVYQPTLVISPPSAPVQVGNTVSLAALYDADGPAGPSGNTPVTPSAAWSSDNSAIATVNASGIVTGVSAGSTIIRAAYTDSFGNALIATANVTVSALPVLSISLSASPPSPGIAPFSTTLTAEITSYTGNPADTINYSLWWNCSQTTTNVSTAEAACGSLPAPSLGNCAENSVGYKCNAVNSTSRSIPHTYATPTGSPFSPKVIIERDSAAPKEARIPITVSWPAIGGSCAVPLSADVGDPVTWGALGTGGDGSYTYEWYSMTGSPSPATCAGQPSLACQNFTTSYSTTGTKSGNVRIRSAGLTPYETACSNSVTISGKIISFGGTPPVIFSGGTANLGWTTSGYSNGQCSINNGIGVVNASGSVPTPVLTTTTTYRITCDDGTGPEWRDATIIVGSPPTIREIPP